LPFDPTPDHRGRVWLITGASSGFGRAIAAAALAAGDFVVGAARQVAALDSLVAADPDRARAVRLDVTDPGRGAEVVTEVISRFGRLDVLVNNAGRTQVGAVEETTDRELRDLMDLHLHGPAALIRAALPHMRSQGSGAIMQMSSIGGQLSFAGFGAYSATKCALEGLSEALAQEVAPYGIKVLIVEPGSFRTGLFGGGAYRSAATPAYADTVGPTRVMIDSSDGTQPGDPAKAAAAILVALDAETTPLRLPLGHDAVDALAGHADGVRAELREWEKISRGTDFDVR
jgi:NAD(P)-dependent dehydrogenase (short-subunit alcohol dehydrogenase family)